MLKLVAHLWRFFKVLLTNNSAWHTKISSVWEETRHMPIIDDRLVKTPMSPALHRFINGEEQMVLAPNPKERLSLRETIDTLHGFYQENLQKYGMSEFVVEEVRSLWHYDDEIFLVTAVIVRRNPTKHIVWTVGVLSYDTFLVTQGRNGEGGEIGFSLVTSEDVQKFKHDSWRSLEKAINTDLVQN